MKNTYAVFGLGRYGTAVARELVENGMEVIAVDADQRIVNAAADQLPICKCADITDPDVIAQLGIANVDVVIIAMANNLEASVMAVTLCKEAGVEMTPAGASYPYGNDPQDSNIRIAPSFPPEAELEKAMDVFCTCLKIAALEKLMNG